LKEQNAVLQTRLCNEEKRTQENLNLLDQAEAKFIVKLSEPVLETLERLNAEITIVKERATNVGAVASNLVKALQKPEVRGQWGEMHLRRVVEVAGMLERCDFDEQQVIGNGDGQLRPDLVVHYPGDKHLAVDAKAPLRAFLEAAEADDDESRKAKLREFVLHVREHIKTLGTKAYHQQLDNSAEFVVLFLPSEAIFSAALTLDAEISEYAAKYRVHLAGPCVLITLLRAVALGWKQESLAAHAKEICTLGEDLYKRLAVFGGHLGRVGKSLNNSVSAYNDAIGSLEMRVMPQARRFEQIGAAPADSRLEELAPVETTARALQCADFALSETNGELDAEESLFRPR
jgi:DNA recombination protein RmuC